MNKVKNNLFLDIETSGLPQQLGYNKYYPPHELLRYNSSRIIELGYIIADDYGTVLKKYESLVIPDNFTITNSRFHGITDKMCKEKGLTMIQNLKNMLKDMLKYNVNKIVSHNINFDINILLSECVRKNNNKLLLEINECKLECTMYLGQKYMNYYKSPKLIELYEYLFKKKFNQKHRALDDVNACMECYYKMMY